MFQNDSSSPLSELFHFFFYILIQFYLSGHCQFRFSLPQINSAYNSLSASYEISNKAFMENFFAVQSRSIQPLLLPLSDPVLLAENRQRTVANHLQSFRFFIGILLLLQKQSKTFNSVCKRSFKTSLIRALFQLLIE